MGTYRRGLYLTEAPFQQDLSYLYYFYSDVLLLAPVDDPASQAAYRRAYEIYPE